MMGLFGPSKGSIGKTIQDKVKAGEPHGTGAATQVQARKARARQKEIKEKLKQDKQDAADIRRAKLIKGPPNAGKAKKFDEKAKAAGDKRRQKKELKKQIRKSKYWA